MGALRHDIGTAAERIAASFLTRRGVEILATNLTLGRGEVDLVGRHRGRLVVFEVRSVTTGSSPVEAFDRAKADQLTRLSARLGIGRVDLVAVGFSPRFVVVRWLPHVL